MSFGLGRVLPACLILDVDGTLIDSNYQHVLSWYEAFRSFGVTLPLWKIHRAIGMGGEELVRSLVGPSAEGAAGAAIRREKARLFASAWGSIAPFPDATGFLETCAARGYVLVVASSASDPDVERAIDLLGARSYLRGWVSAEDVEHAKPSPDLFQAAVSLAGTEDALVIGDSAHDCRAASAAGLLSVALLTGGIGETVLRQAGAIEVFGELRRLVEYLDRSDRPLRDVNRG